MMPRAVVFDLDGTLIDSRGDIAAACNHVLRSAGRAALPVETIAGFVGDGARALLARAFAMSGDDVALEPLLAEWAGYYAAHPFVNSRWMPGAEAAMVALEARGAKLALVTNKLRSVTLAILGALGIAGRFAAIYAGGDGPLKPSAEPILRVMRAMGVTADGTWVVGDGPQDIGAGRAAGCKTIAVLGGFHDEAALRVAGASQVISSLALLPGLNQA